MIKKLFKWTDPEAHVNVPEGKFMAAAWIVGGAEGSKLVAWGAAKDNPRDAKRSAYGCFENIFGQAPNSYRVYGK